MLEFISVLPSTGDGTRLGGQEPERLPSFTLLRDAALTAEAVGFQAALITTGHTNNHFDERVGYVDSVVTASALIPVTDRLRLLLAIRPGSVDAALGARIGATMDVFSNGRFLINVVCGAAPALMYGEVLDNSGRHERAAEFTQVLHLWWVQEKASFQGRYFTLREAKCWPKPVQRPHPPVYMSGSSPATLEIAARLADCLLLPGMRLYQAADVAGTATRLAAEHGRRLRLGIHFYVIARATRQQALEAADEQVGHIAEAVRARLGGRAGTLAHSGSVYWTGMRRLWRGASIALVGSYQEIAATLASYADAGFATFVISAYPACGETKRFGQEIIPRMSDGPAEEAEQD
ncbi:MAG TPA: LLM class flavin-dependent oxidoreductase [Trebonia sp.]